MSCPPPQGHAQKKLKFNVAMNMPLHNVRFLTVENN